MLNQTKNENLNIKFIQTKALQIIEKNNDLKNFLELKTFNPKALIQKIEENPLQIYFYTFETKFGKIRIFCNDMQILAIDFDNTEKDNIYILKNFSDSIFVKSKKHCEYFLEKLFFSKKENIIKTGIKGSLFFIKILKILSKTNPAQLLSYKELAEKAGFKNAQRAVGTVMKNNPLPFLIPCHRVIKSGQKLGYYSGGTNRKIIFILREHN
jgi:O-6-methylguanine DNA methyltransferase